MGKKRKQSEDDPGPPPKEYRVLKCRWSRILRHVIREDGSVLDNDGPVQSVVTRMNAITTHALFLTKQYCLHLFSTGQEFPVLDRSFYMAAMKTMIPGLLEPKSAKKKQPQFIRDLFAFHKSHYLPTVPEGDREHDGFALTQCMGYVATQMVTNLENNIREHFLDHLETFVRFVLEQSGEIDGSKLKSTTYAVKNQMVQYAPTLACVEKHTPQIIPLNEKEIGDKKRHVAYDLKCSPLRYLPGMMYMTQYIEERGGDCAKLRNVFPLKTDLVPGAICLDTFTLVKLFAGGKNKDLLGTQTSYGGKFLEKQGLLFDTLFHTQSSCFRSGAFKFNHMIYTDGYSCSVYLARDVDRDKHLQSSEEQYIDQVSGMQQEVLQAKRLVGIDPNQQDLMYCVALDNMKDRTAQYPSTFRYTRSQVAAETKTQNYSARREHRYQHTSVDGKSIKAWHNEMSTHNHKTLSYEKFTAYLEAKNKMNFALRKTDEDFFERRLRFYGYLNRQRSEANMVNAFSAKFGAPDKVAVAFGDWEQGALCKGLAPAKGKGLRTVLRKAGYRVLLVDEFRTSQKCYHCQSAQAGLGICEKFQKRVPRKSKDGVGRFVHGLLRCNTCSRTWNRDTNAALNILYAAQCAVDGIGRPAYLDRSQTETARSTAGDTQLESKCAKRKRRKIK